MSLDLNKLANKLDEALSNETTETLTEFLKNKRMSSNKKNNQQLSGKKQGFAKEFSSIRKLIVHSKNKQQ